MTSGHSPRTVMTGTPGFELEFISEEFYTTRVVPEHYDDLLAGGWRHFGTRFFRYNLAVFEGEIRRVIPLRIRLASSSLSKSQRRVLSKNSDLRVKIGPIQITGESEKLFDRHKLRFENDIPGSIYDFLSPEPDIIPLLGRELAVYDHDRLIAVSYFDLGRRSASGIYAAFEPEESARGLGIFTMLKEIEFATQIGCEFYYHGYAYEGRSFYDYKKRFRGLEAFDWHENWRPFT